MDEKKLIDRLRRIEALHAGTSSDGERLAAEKAIARIKARLDEIRAVERTIAYRISLPDPWSRKLFLALARRYGLRPYRRYRQRYSTVMLRVPERFMDEVLWPEFDALSETLSSFLSEVTERVIREGLDGDTSEAAEEPKQIQG